jgi:hypothetical protein
VAAVVVFFKNEVRLCCLRLGLHNWLKDWISVHLKGELAVLVAWSCSQQPPIYMKSLTPSHLPIELLLYTSKV